MRIRNELVMVLRDARTHTQMETTGEHTASDLCTHSSFVCVCAGFSGRVNVVKREPRGQHTQDLHTMHG